jgi:hypothetical protein
VKVHVYIPIKGSIDSLMLWKLIEQYKVNLTADDNQTWVYGEVSYTVLGELVAKCCLFGDVDVTVKR